jgi:tetratricopeptide (TPR) repeat protein
MTPDLALVLTLLNPNGAAKMAEEADILYAEEKFAEASAAYADAYQDDPNPDYLYGWAQSERRAGNCTQAVELYREYASLPVSEAARGAAATNAKRCGGDIEAPLTPPLPTATPKDEPRRKNREAWRSDVIGLSLVAGGGALGVASLVLAVDSQQQWRLAEEADLEATYAKKIDRSNQTRTAAIICGSIGAVAMVAGAIRLAVVDRNDRERRLSWMPGRGVRF